jgi:hypothetical protein
LLDCSHNKDTVPIQPAFSQSAPNHKTVSFVSLPASGCFVTRHALPSAFWLLGWLMLAGAPEVVAMPAPTEVGPARISVDATTIPTELAQTQPVPAPAPATAPAQAAGDEPIGNVATLTGSASVTRNNRSSQLKLQDDIFMNDVLQTSANSTLSVTFNDATTFNLTANAKITVDNFVYEDGGKQNKALFGVTRGTVAFVAAALAKSGDMKISTPTATLGIRGTTGLVEVPEGASAASANNVAIKLYPDADGKVGRIEVNDRAGARLGFLTQGSSGFTIRPEIICATIRRFGPVRRNRMVCRYSRTNQANRNRSSRACSRNRIRPACRGPGYRTGPPSRSCGRPCRCRSESCRRKNARAASSNSRMCNRTSWM